MPRKELNMKDGKPRYKGITIDADLAEALNARADELFDQFGFRPTISQTLRHIMMKEKNQ